MDHFCKNHPVTRAISKCHVCQNYYCASCLIEGFEYYYCKQDDCLKVLDEKLIPSENKCPSCSDRIILELDERIDKRFHCPNCEKYINKWMVKNFVYSVTKPIVAATSRKESMSLLKWFGKSLCAWRYLPEMRGMFDVTKTLLFV